MKTTQKQQTPLADALLDCVSNDAQHGNATGFKSLVACAERAGVSDATLVERALAMLVETQQIEEVSRGVYELRVAESATMTKPARRTGVMTRQMQLNSGRKVTHKFGDASSAPRAAKHRERCIRWALDGVVRDQFALIRDVAALPLPFDAAAQAERMTTIRSLSLPIPAPYDRADADALRRQLLSVYGNALVLIEQHASRTLPDSEAIVQHARLLVENIDYLREAMTVAGL